MTDNSIRIYQKDAGASHFCLVGTVRGEWLPSSDFRLERSAGYHVSGSGLRLELWRHFRNGSEIVTVQAPFIYGAADYLNLLPYSHDRNLCDGLYHAANQATAGAIYHALVDNIGSDNKPFTYAVATFVLGSWDSVSWDFQSQLERVACNSLSRKLSQDIDFTEHP